MRRSGKATRTYKHVQWLDNVLTLTTLAQFVAVVYVLSKERLEGGSSETGIFEFFGFLFGCYFVLQIVKSFFKALAYKIGTEKVLKKSRNVVKFSDQGWQFAIHFVMSMVELYLLSRNDWELVRDTRLLFEREQPKDKALRTVYVCQLAIWLFTAYMHRFVEARHKDYYLMFTHHVVTIALVVGSYEIGYTRVGLLVLFVHDFSDIFVDALKLTNYMGLDSDAGYLYVEISFASLLVSWLALRLYYFPLHVVYSAIFESAKCLEFSEREVPKLYDGYGGWDAGYGTVGTKGVYGSLGHAVEILFKNPFDSTSAFRWLLITLVGMHVWWYYLLLRILARMVFGKNAHEAGAEEYEGASSDSDAAVVHEKPKHE